jgi:hypothetical protein
MRSIAVAAAMAVGIVGPAWAGPYVVLHATEDIVTFADQATVKREAGRLFMWTYSVLPRDLRDGAALMASKTEVDCPGRRQRDVLAVSYTWAGKAVTTDSTVGDWAAIAPGTFDMRVVHLACEGQAKEIITRQGTYLDAARMAREVMRRNAQ